MHVRVPPTRSCTAPVINLRASTKDSRERIDNPYRTMLLGDVLAPMCTEESGLTDDRDLVIAVCWIVCYTLTTDP